MSQPNQNYAELRHRVEAIIDKYGTMNCRTERTDDCNVIHELERAINEVDTNNVLREMRACSSAASPSS